MPDTILLDQREGVLTITLNRPDVLNAFNEQMLRELHDALRQAERDAAVRCVLLTGAGRGFCSREGLRGRAGKTPLFFPGTLRGRLKPVLTQNPPMEKTVLPPPHVGGGGAGGVPG